MRRSVVEMARTVGCNPVVDGRAADPDRDRQRACPRSPGSCTPRRSSATREWRTRTFIFIAATSPDPRRQQACARSPGAAHPGRILGDTGV